MHKKRGNRESEQRKMNGRIGAEYLMEREKVLMAFIVYGEDV
jgi:hypothetical protein